MPTTEPATPLTVADRLELLAEAIEIDRDLDIFVEQQLPAIIATNDLGGLADVFHAEISDLRRRCARVAFAQCQALIAAGYVSSTETRH